MIHYSKDTAKFGQSVQVELAEELFAWLIAKPKRKVDASQCEHLHSSVLQVLLMCKPKLTKLPANEWLKQALHSLTQEV